MSVPVLAAQDVTKRFGGLVAVDRVSLALPPGEVHAVIGPNGAGKTTFLSVLAGELRPEAGRVRLQGRDITRLPVHRRARLGLARGFQLTSVFPSFSVADNVALAVQAQDGHSFRFWRPALTDPRLRAPALAALEQVGLAGVAGRRAATLSHGEKRQLEIAMVLAGRPAALLLDEPTAGMGPEESQQMVALLQGLKGRVAMLLVEHDMEAVFALADQVTVLVQGAVLASGPPAAVRGDPAVRAAYLGESGPEGGR